MATKITGNFIPSLLNDGSAVNPLDRAFDSGRLGAIRSQPGFPRPRIKLATTNEKSMSEPRSASKRPHHFTAAPPNPCAVTLAALFSRTESLQKR